MSDARQPELSNTKMETLRHITKEKSSLAVDVRSSKTSLPKIPISLSTPYVSDIIIHLYHLLSGCTITGVRAGGGEGGGSPPPQMLGKARC